MDDFIRNSDPRVVAALLAIVVVLTVTVEVKYLLWPKVALYLELNDSLQVLRGAAGSSEGLEQLIDVSRQQVEDLGYQLHGDMAGLPAKKLESYVIGRLQKYSWDTDVELVSVFARGDSLGCSDNSPTTILVQQAEIKIGEGAGTLDAGQRRNLANRQAQLAEAKVVQRSLGLRLVECIGRYLDRTHAVAQLARLFCHHLPSPLNAWNCTIPDR